MVTEIAEKLVVVEKLHGMSVDFLGELLWYTISDMRVTREQLEAAFDEVGVDHAHLPSPVHYRDAFRRATTNAEVSRLPAGPGRFVNLLVREVKVTDDEIVRHLVREVVDATNVRLEYTPVAALICGKDEQLLAVRLGPEVGEAERCLVAKAKAEYLIERSSYNSKNVRDIVTRILKTCAPVSVRPSGGVFFVPATYQDTVTKLRALVDRLAGFGTSGSRSRVWAVPPRSSARWSPSPWKTK